MKTGTSRLFGAILEPHWPFKRKLASKSHAQFPLKQLLNSSECLVRILTLLNFSFPSITPKEASPKGFTLFQFVLLTLESFVYFSPAFPESSTWCCTQCQELQGTHFGTQSSLFSLFPLRLYPPSLQKLAAVPLRDTVY